MRENHFISYHKLIKTQEVVIGASISVSKHNEEIIKTYSFFSSIPCIFGFFFSCKVLKEKEYIIQYTDRMMNVLNSSEPKVEAKIIIHVNAKLQEVRGLKP